MRFVEIVPPEAGQLDEHRAVVAVTSAELTRLRGGLHFKSGVATLNGHAADPEDVELGQQLADVSGRLTRRRQLAEMTQDSQDMGTYDLTDQGGPDGR